MKSFFGKPKQINYHFYYEKNDVLGQFVKEMDNFKFKNQGYFFYLHNEIPHDPFVFDSDCSSRIPVEYSYGDVREKFDEKGLDNKHTYIGYKKNYECMIKRVFEFINFINKNDPEANVIITADHGRPPFVFDTLTMVKLNKECQQNISDKLNFPNNARVLLGCTVGQKINLLERKSYSVKFERGSWSVGGVFKLERIN